MILFRTSNGRSVHSVNPRADSTKRTEDKSGGLKHQKSRPILLEKPAFAAATASRQSRKQEGRAAQSEGCQLDAPPGPPPGAAAPGSADPAAPPRRRASAASLSALISPSTRSTSSSGRNFSPAGPWPPQIARPNRHWWWVVSAGWRLGENKDLLVPVAAPCDYDQGAGSDESQLSTPGILGTGRSSPS